MTLGVTVAADRLGRRRALIGVSLLTGFGYLAAADSASLIWLIPNHCACAGDRDAGLRERDRGNDADQANRR